MLGTENMQLVSKPSAFEGEVAVYKLKNYRSPNVHQIQAESVRAVGRRVCWEIHKIINSVWTKEEWPPRREEAVIIVIMVTKQIMFLSRHIGVIIYLQNFIQHTWERLTPH